MNKTNKCSYNRSLKRNKGVKKNGGGLGDLLMGNMGNYPDSTSQSQSNSLLYPKTDGCGCGGGINGSSNKKSKRNITKRTAIKGAKKNTKPLKKCNCGKLFWGGMKCGCGNKSFTISELTGIGGKRNKTPPTKGGFLGFSDFIIGSNSQNALLSSLSSPGSLDSYNQLNMQNNMNPSIYAQPALKMYHDDNQPMI
jgi:hypothetical protein